MNHNYGLLNKGKGGEGEQGTGNELETESG